MFTIKKPQPVSVPDGTYDAVIDSVEFRATNNGKRYIEASCRIRADQGVPQLRVPYKIWKAKNPGKDDIAVGGYLAFQLFNLADAAGIPAETNYNTMEDLFADLEGLPISVTVCFFCTVKNEVMIISAFILTGFFLNTDYFHIDRKSVV